VSPSQPTKACPPCPKCDCSGEFDVSKCDSVCHSREETCAAGDEQSSYALRVLLWLEKLFPPAVAPWILLSGVVLFVLIFLRSLASIIFTPAVAQRRYDSGYDERALRNAVTYYPDYNGQSPAAPTAAAPQGSMPRGSNGTDIFSPSSQASPAPSSQQRQQFRNDQRMHDLHDIYESPSSIITPSRTGDGVRRRSPFSADRF